MTVQELIELLKTLPQTAKVELTGTAGCTDEIETWYWQRDNEEYVFLNVKE